MFLGKEKYYVNAYFDDKEIQFSRDNFKDPNYNIWIKIQHMAIYLSRPVSVHSYSCV